MLQIFPGQFQNSLQFILIKISVYKVPSCSSHSCTVCHVLYVVLLNIMIDERKFIFFDTLCFFYDSSTQRNWRPGYKRKCQFQNVSFCVSSDLALASCTPKLPHLHTYKSLTSPYECMSMFQNILLGF